MNEQELFWKNIYGEEYRSKNQIFDNEKGSEAWEKMLSKCEKENFKILECGCNIGRNISQIKKAFPNFSTSVIEINKEALEICKSKNKIEKSFNGSIINCDFEPNQFDLVFTMGVLIHIAPENLIDTMSKIKNLSKRYVLFGEYILVV